MIPTTDKEVTTMKRNRYIAAFLALILLISLAGCGASATKNSYAEEPADL